MNFIASSLIYHCDEFVAFWLLTIIIKDLELKDIYLPSMKFSRLVIRIYSF